MPYVTGNAEISMERGNFHRVDLGDLTLWFSYRTLIGFESPIPTLGKKVCENVWGATTGKHLNRIEPDKKKRVSLVDFQDAVHELIDYHQCDLSHYEKGL